MARLIDGTQPKAISSGKRQTNPDAGNNRWRGAVTFPNGAVYFPTGDYFILPNGYKILNGPNAKADIDKYIKAPRRQDGGLQYPPGQAPRPEPPGNSPKPIDTPKGQPSPNPPGNGGPNPPGGGGVKDTPLGGIADGPQGPGTGGNFAKGQPRYDQTAGGAFMPFLEQFYGRGGFDPYMGGPYGSMGGAYGNGSNGGYGQGGSGYGMGIPYAGMAQSYDPLGIGQAAYMDDNADYYPMVGANAATGYQGMPRWGVVGGQGGYGIGMVGPEYSGPLWNSYPDINLLQQRAALTTPTTAQQSPWAMPAPQQSNTNTTTNTTNTNTNGTSNVNTPKGQPSQQQNQAQQPATSYPNQVQWNPAWGTPTDQYGNPITAQQYNQRLSGQAPVYDPNTFNTQYGNLVTSSTGNSNLYKQNGSDGSQLYYYDPQRGWQQTTGQNAPTNLADPNQYAGQAGGVQNQFITKNGMRQLKPGTGVYS